jgi:hypothetical protein
MTAGFGLGGTLSDLAMIPGCAGNVLGVAFGGFEDSCDGSKLFGLPVPYLAAHFPMPLKRVEEGLPGRRPRHFGRTNPQRTHMKTTRTIAMMNMMMSVLLELEVRRSRSRRARGGMV